jgi:hypothetical protein
LISFLLRACNDLQSGVLGVYVLGLMPTMKSQLSQLPLIVGSGRVLIRRALFSCLVH